MQEYLLDVRDLDTEYFTDVRVWLDPLSDRYYFPRESAERLGELADDGAFYLLDGSVVAEPEEINVGGVAEPAWSVAVNQLTVRSARTSKQG